MGDGIDFTLRLEPPTAAGAPSGAVVVGEAVRVAASVRNLNDVDAVVMLGAMPPVIYQLTRNEAATPPLTLLRSPAEGLEIAIVDSQMPPIEETPQLVPPGETYEMSDDLVACNPIGLPVGEYQIVARCPVDGIDMVSNEVTVHVEAARPTHVNALYCRHSVSHALAFDHTDADGRSWLLLNDTRGEMADAGSFHRLCSIPGDGELQGLALGTHVQPGLSGRWTAWLRDSRLGACQAEGGRIVREAAPCPVALDRPLLVATGFERSMSTSTDPNFDHGDATFIVIGEHQGNAHVQFFDLIGAGWTPGPVVPLTSGPRPSRVSARCASSGARIDLVWADVIESSTRILRRGYGAGGRPLSPAPMVAFELAAPLLALEVYALDHSTRAATQSRVHALFGPITAPRAEGGSPAAPPGPAGVAATPSLRYVRIEVAGAGETGDLDAAEEHALLLPDWPNSRPFEHCAISALEAGALGVFGLRGNEVWRASVGQPGWELFYRGPSPLSQLHALASNEAYWAMLVMESGAGLVCRRDPAYSTEAG